MVIFITKIFKNCSKVSKAFFDFAKLFIKDFNSTLVLLVQTAILMTILKLISLLSLDELINLLDKIK